MNDEFNFRKADLWEGRTSDDIWTSFRKHLDASLDGVLGKGRKRAFVDVKDVRPSSAPLEM